MSAVNTLTVAVFEDVSCAWMAEYLRVKSDHLCLEMRKL